MNTMFILKPFTSYHLFYTVLLFCIISPEMRAQQEFSDPENDSISFMVLADSQFGFYTKNKGFSRETANFEKAIALANRLHPAFVIVNGDLVNQAGNSEQIAEYKRIASNLDSDIPLYNVPGNHDIKNRPTPESLKDYRKAFGKDYYSFKNQNIYGIVLNSMLIAQPGKVEQESEKQFKWLASELKKAKGQGFSHILIFQHIPFFIKSPEEETSYYSKYSARNIPLEKRKVYLNLLHKYGVEYVFAGHLHENAIGKDPERGIKVITTSSLAKPLGEDPAGYRIITIKNDKVNYPFYRLDENL